MDYGSQGSVSHGFEISPEQALVSRSQQILRTIPRFQYEAPSWVPNLLEVQDTQAEINAEVCLLSCYHYRKLMSMSLKQFQLKFKGRSTRLSKIIELEFLVM